MAEFEHDEIETVLAHELVHHVNKDIPLGIVVSRAVTLIGLYLAKMGLEWGVNYFGFEGVRDSGRLVNKHIPLVTSYDSEQSVKAFSGGLQRVHFPHERREKTCKTSSVRHTCSIYQDRSNRPTTASPDEEVQAQLKENDSIIRSVLTPTPFPTP